MNVIKFGGNISCMSKSGESFHDSKVDLTVEVSGYNKEKIESIKILFKQMLYNDFEHKDLNMELSVEPNPFNISKLIYDSMKNLVNGIEGVKIDEVEFFETEKYSVVYKEDSEELPTKESE